MHITFLLPHQRRTTGGAYTIQHYATLLAPRHHVTVAVRKGERRAVPGCDVVPFSAAGPSDIVVVPADWLDDIPDGKRIYYLQGFVDPGNPTVVARLNEGRAVIAISKWLAEEARKRGCPTRYVPPGLDRSIFYPGIPASAREKSVLMLTHSQNWKGTADGVEALSIVQRHQPDVLVTMYGTYDPGTDATFVWNPSLDRVAELMRSAAVLVSPSWEEGLGLPGLEGMACGAAIATTDSKGSRDYAVDGVSALVTPPREPSRLAEATLRLLEDKAVRERIARGGLMQVDRYPTWDESAALYEDALVSM